MNLRCVNGTVVFAQLQTLPTLDLPCEKVQEVPYFFLYLSPENKHLREEAVKSIVSAVLHAVDNRLGSSGMNHSFCQLP